jgi:spore coat protein CotH
MRMPSRPVLLACFLVASTVLLPAPASSQTAPGPAPGPTAADLFNQGVVQQLHLFLNSRDWKALQETYRENTYYPADLHWNGLVVRNIGIRSRGLGSRNAIKPGLRLDFDRYATTQKFLGLKSLVLDNLVQDLPMMRERLVMSFLAKMGEPAPRVVHTGLWVNNVFIGLYTVVESIDKDFVERTFGEDDGYLYEYNNVPGWYFTDSDPVPFTLDNLARIFEPKTRESDPIGEQMGPVLDMLRDANHASDFVGTVGQRLDLEAFVRYVATEQFMAEHDGIVGYDGCNNFYFYRSVKTGKARFISWDKDNSFYNWNHSLWGNVEKNPLVYKALRDPGLRAIFLETLEKAAAIVMAPPEPEPVAPGAGPGDEPVQGWLEWEIRRIHAQINEGAHADIGKLITNERFDEEIEYMIDFARRRANYVLDEVRRDRARIAEGRYEP